MFAWLLVQEEVQIRKSGVVKQVMDLNYVDDNESDVITAVEEDHIINNYDVQLKKLDVEMQQSEYNKDQNEANKTWRKNWAIVW